MRRGNNYLTLGVIAVSVFAMGQPYVRNIDAYFLERGNALPRAFHPIWFLILPTMAIAFAFIGKQKWEKYSSFAIATLLVTNVIMGIAFVPPMPEVGAFGFEFFVKPIYCAYIVFVIFCGYICYSQDNMMKYLISGRGFIKKTSSRAEYEKYYQCRALVYFAAAMPAAKGLFIDWLSDGTRQSIIISICIFILAKLITRDLRLQEN